MGLIGTLVGYAISAFILLLIGRLILDWATVLGSNPSWTRRARELTHTATEPVLAPVRKVLRPVRAGGVSIDLAFTVVFVLALILRSVAFGL